jgi:thiamine-monophosphate kinase
MEMMRLGAGPEFDLIRRIAGQAKQTHPLIRVGPGDDCAILGDLALSIDASVENVHFRRDWLSAEEIGWRATSAALSDLAAVAAEPIGILITLALPQKDAVDFVEPLMRGAIAAAAAVGASLIGGDVANSETLMIDVVAVGKAEAPVLRSGAIPGDAVWVTGTLGGSAAAVAALSNNAAPNDAARSRYARPHPRTQEAIWLRDRGVLHAMIDLSDGLFGDLQHIAAAGSCGIVVDTGAIPIHAEAGASHEHAVIGGEDYELAFAAEDGAIEDLQREFTARFNLPITRVGEVIAGSGLHERLHDGTQRPITARGYQHFGKQGR